MHAATTLIPETILADPTAGYNLVRDLIFFQVHSFRRQYGGVVEDLISEANLAFVKSHNQFISGKTPAGEKITDSYATVINRSVWYRLFDSMRLRVRRDHLAKMVPIENAVGVADEKGFDILDLSPDARYVVALILDPPDHIISKAQNKGGENRNYRSAIREFLQDQKWNSTKIDQSFDEIRHAL